MTEKRIFLIIFIVIVMASCMSAEQDKKERERLRNVKMQEVTTTSTSPCFPVEIEGCEYIYCFYERQGTGKFAIAVTPKLNQKNPEVCNLSGKARY